MGFLSFGVQLQRGFQKGGWSQSEVTSREKTQSEEKRRVEPTKGPDFNLKSGGSHDFLSQEFPAITLYIDDLSIDDWSSILRSLILRLLILRLLILRSSILNISTIYIDDPNIFQSYNMEVTV